MLDALFVALADHRDQEVHEHHVAHHHHQEPDDPHYVLVLSALNHGVRIEISDDLSQGEYEELSLRLCLLPLFAIA